MSWALGCLCALAVAAGCSTGPRSDEATAAAVAAGFASPGATDPGERAGFCGETRGLDGPLVELPEQLKRADFRLSPPPVQSVFAGPGAAGGTSVIVNFGPDRRLRALERLVLRPDEAPIVLTRATPAAGMGAAPGISFSAQVPVPFADVLADQQALRALAARQGSGAIPIFEGRDLVGTSPLPALPGPSPSGGLPTEMVELAMGFPGLIAPERSLFVTDLAVVEDPARTFNPCTQTGTPMGAWTFGRLMSDMAGTMPASQFVLTWFETLLTTQTINGQSIIADANLGLNGASRPLQGFLDAWPRVNGELDLSRAPFKLLAIVNRIDLAGNVSYGPVAGAEGRLVFEMVDETDGSCNPLDFTVIFEYGIPISTCSALRSWAQQWEALGGVSISSPAFNPALQALTDRFAGGNANPAKPNGSALDQLRTDHLVLEQVEWELREFHLQQNGPGAALLTPATVAQTPTLSYDDVGGGPPEGGPFGPLLGRWIEANPAPYTVPLLLPFAERVLARALPGPFRGGASDNIDPFGYWSAPGPTEPAMHTFSLNTCNGCHGRETATNFLQILPTPFGQEAQLSAFLTGETNVFNPRAGPSLSYNDLLRRELALQAYASPFCGAVLPPPPVLPGLVRLPLPPLETVPILASH